MSDYLSQAISIHMYDFKAYKFGAQFLIRKTWVFFLLVIRLTS